MIRCRKRQRRTKRIRKEVDDEDEDEPILTSFGCLEKVDQFLTKLTVSRKHFWIVKLFFCSYVRFLVILV